MFTIFDQKIEFGAVQKYVNLVDLEKCCKMSIYLQNLASIQPRRSPPKFGGRFSRACAEGARGTLRCQERILFGTRAIAELAAEQIGNGDVILVYGRSSTVPQIAESGRLRPRGAAR